MVKGAQRYILVIPVDQYVPTYELYKFFFAHYFFRRCTYAEILLFQLFTVNMDF